MSRIVLVTGAAGFVGTHLIQALLGPSIDTVVAWTRPREPDESGHSSPPREHSDDPRVHWQAVDLLKAEAVADAVEASKPNLIYHCAGVASVHGSWKHTLASLQVNVQGTDHLLRAVASASPAARVLIPGSAMVYRPSSHALREDAPLGPVSPYGVSKLAQEMLAQCYAQQGLAVLLTRSFTHIGPGQAVSYATSSFAQQIARIEAKQTAPVIRVGNLDARRDLTDVRDTVRAYTSLMERGVPGRPYNVCSGEAHRVGDVLNALIAQARTPVRVEIDQSRLRPSDNPLLIGDATRLAHDVDWEPRIPLQTTLADLLDYWRRNLR